MPKCSISIIIPTYNRLQYLKRVLPTYTNQKYIKEIIIVDDYSNDGTEDYIKINYPEIKYIKLEKRSGAAIAKQVGINNAEGNYLLFGEDDLYFGKYYSKTLLQDLIENDADIIGGRIIYLKEDESENKALQRNNYKVKKLYDRHFNNYFNTIRDDDEVVLFLHACYLAKKEIFDKIDYDNGYQGNGWREETDPLVEANKNGYKVYFCPHTTCFHLPRETNGGGQHHFSKLEYEYWVYKNNLKFLTKHKNYLKKRGVLIINPFFHNSIYILLRSLNLISLVVKNRFRWKF